MFGQPGPGPDVSVRGYAPPEHYGVAAALAIAGLGLTAPMAAAVLGEVNAAARAAPGGSPNCKPDGRQVEDRPDPHGHHSTPADTEARCRRRPVRTVSPSPNQRAALRPDPPRQPLPAAAAQPDASAPGRRGALLTPAARPIKIRGALRAEDLWHADRQLACGTCQAGFGPRAGTALQCVVRDDVAQDA